MTTTKMAKMPQGKRKPSLLLDPQKELVKLFNGLSGRQSHWQVFSDFCEISAISISNAVDWHHREEREDRYMQIVKGYKPEEVQRLCEGLGHLVMALEGGFTDVLGCVFHDLELHNKWAGQYFTPYPICRMMAKMTVGDRPSLRNQIEERGFITAMEPACGSGGMIIALADAMHDAGINYQQHLHVTAVDVDLKCVHMAYLQFSLLHIPAVIVHGNTLSLQEYSHWYTPAHIMGGWAWKLRRQEAAEKPIEIQTPGIEPQAEPTKKTLAPAQQQSLFDLLAA